MDSPQMYDTQQLSQSNAVMNHDKKTVIINNNNLTNLTNSTGTTKQTAQLLKQHHIQQYQQHQGDLSDLNTPEISLDLQNLIDDSQFNEGLFSDILQNQVSGKHIQSLHPRQVMSSSNYPRTTLAYMPQPVHSGATYAGNGNQTSSSDSNSSGVSETPLIKEEPVDPQDFRRPCSGNVLTNNYMQGGPSYQTNGNATGFSSLTPSTVLHHQQLNAMKNKTMMMNQHAARKHMKPCDKNSDEYRRRRERNNIAVRKSREKAKVRTRETEEKVKILLKENERLQKRIEGLSEELTVLKALIQNVGSLPENIHREFSKHIDAFHLQHQQHMLEERSRVMDIINDYGQ